MNYYFQRDRDSEREIEKEGGEEKKNLTMIEVLTTMINYFVT